MTVQFRILGPVVVETAGKIIPLRRRERCLLGLLLLDANRIVPVDRLAELVWRGDPPKQVRGAVQGVVSRLRAAVTAIGDTDSIALTFVGGGYRLAVDPESVDAHQFRELVHRASVTTDLETRANLLRAATDLWRGPALADAVSGWVRDRVCAELDEQRLTATEDLISTSLALRNEHEILPELARIAGEQPGRERLIELHMRALYQAGRRVDALEAYAHARATLADEFGLDPSPNLRKLHQAILRDELTIPVDATAQASSTAASSSTYLPASPSTLRAPNNVVPRQLPADVPGFTGRTAYLDQLDSLLASVDGTVTPVVVSAIGGAGGIGKTALAVHWAHRVAERFPDGQLYLNLRGFGPRGSSMEPAEAVRAVLDGLEVTPDRIPASLDGQVSLYRSLLAGRRMLVVLDNARDAEQVRPILPTTPGCLAVVTSRHQLTSLAAIEGARSLTIEPLTTTEAYQLLAHRLGSQRVTEQADATAEVIARCGCFPLALTIAAARAAKHPTFPLEIFAEELRATRRSLDAFDGGDSSSNVRSVFSWSYDALNADAALLFRLLGLHPGLDITAPAAASMLATSMPKARTLLAELTGAHMLSEHIPGRYTLHDLLRTFAIDLTLTRDSDSDRRAALARLLDHYVYSAHCASAQLFTARDPITLEPTQAGVTPETFADFSSASAWLVAEYQVLQAAIEHAAASGFDTHVWQLTWTLTAFAHRRGDWHALVTSQNAALDCARRLADQTQEARMHRELGLTYAKMRRYHDAKTHLDQALGLYRPLADSVGRAHTFSTLSFLSGLQGNLTNALQYAHQTYTLFRASGHRIGEARCLSAIGWYHTKLGHHRDAIAYCERAIACHHELGDLSAEGSTWDTLGHASQHLGDHYRAVACYQRALNLYRGLGDRYHEAESLTRLGDSYHNVGNLVAAQESWRQAFSILDDLSHPDAESLRSKLQA